MAGLVRLVGVSALIVATALVPGRADAQEVTPDGPCAFQDQRFVDCGNGTVTDAATGLIWLQQADCLMDVPVTEASDAAAGLADGACGLLDGSAPGDWRLPTRADWLATMTPALARGCQAALGGLRPSMNDRPWAECFQELEEQPEEDAAFAAVLSVIYLASEQGRNPTVAALFFLGDGDSSFIGSFGRGFALRVWPVRREGR